MECWVARRPQRRASLARRDFTLSLRGDLLTHKAESVYLHLGRVTRRIRRSRRQVVRETAHAQDYILLGSPRAANIRRFGVPFSRWSAIP
jgi:hypothetical protein